MQCASKKEMPVAYNLPENLGEQEKVYVLADLETGRMLYKEYCSRCHGIFSAAKPPAPDFSKVEVKTNMERALRRAVTRDPIGHRIIRRMMPDEVNQTLGFIQRYKRQ